MTKRILRNAPGWRIEHNTESVTVHLSENGPVVVKVSREVAAAIEAIVGEPLPSSMIEGSDER